MKIRLAFIFLLSLILGIRAGAQGNPLQNIQVSSAVDLVNPMSVESKSNKEDRLDVRSAELMFYGPIDHNFDAVLNLAGHSEEGKFIFEIHEGYVGSSKLIPRSRFRVGKFFLGVGRLNQFHRHDWPFVTAPKVQKEFFADEAASDTGYEYSILLPTSFYLDLTFGVTNGYCYGHCHDLGERPQVPVHYFRPATFFDLENSSGVLLGLNYLGRTDSKGVKMTLLGVDTTYKKKVGKTLRWLLQSEVWHRSLRNPITTDTSTIGAYIFPQYGFDESFLLGCRFDGYSVLNKRFESTGERQKDLDYAVVPTLAYKASEFSTLRLAYSHSVDTTQGESDIRERKIELQFTYMLGAHPAHDF